MDTGRNIPRVVDQSHRCHMGGCGHSPHPFHPFLRSPFVVVTAVVYQNRDTTATLPRCSRSPGLVPLRGTFRLESEVWVFQRLFGGPYVNTLMYINKYFSYIWVPRIDLRAKFKLHTCPKPPPTCAFAQNPCGCLFPPVPPKPSILRNLHSTVTRN